MKKKVWVRRAVAGSEAFKVEVAKNADVDDLKDGIVLKLKSRNENDVVVDHILTEGGAHAKVSALVSSLNIGKSEEQPICFTVKTQLQGNSTKLCTVFFILIF